MSLNQKIKSVHVFHNPSACHRFTVWGKALLKVAVSFKLAGFCSLLALD